MKSRRSFLLAVSHPGGPGKKGHKTVVVVVMLIIYPSHWVCKPAYLVPVPSQDKVGG